MILQAISPRFATNSLLKGRFGVGSRIDDAVEEKGRNLRPPVLIDRIHLDLGPRKAMADRWRAAIAQGFSTTVCPVRLSVVSPRRQHRPGAFLFEERHTLCNLKIDTNSPPAERAGATHCPLFPGERVRHRECASLVLPLVAPHWPWKRTKVREEPLFGCWWSFDGPDVDRFYKKRHLGSLFSLTLSLVCFLCFSAALGKMMEEIEINLPRFDQCIR